MACSNCGAEKVLARGFCSPCYYRLWKTGDVNRKNMRNEGACSVEGCDKNAFSKGFCQQHYHISQHPLKATWKLLRSRFSGQYPPEWDRFDAFLLDVGERPQDKAQLRRPDGNAPWSKTNSLWLLPVGSPKPDSYTPEYRREYEKEWRLNRKFGINTQEYDALLEAQNGTCAICKTVSEQVHRRTGKVRDLAVDHDHKTGIVRGLLCTDCNTTLGLMKDDATVLRAAADYLDRHATPTREEIAA